MLLRRASSVLLTRTTRWPSRFAHTPKDPKDDGFLSASDFAPEGGIKAEAPPRPVPDPENPPTLNYSHYERLKGIDYTGQDVIMETRRHKMETEWQADLQKMREATQQENDFKINADALSKIKQHKLAPQEVEVERGEIPKTSKVEELIVDQDEHEYISVPISEYFNPAAFPQDVDPASFRPKRQKGKCIFCMPDPTLKRVKQITYTNVQLLHAFVNERGMITPRRWNYNCAKHQRKVREAILQARELGLLGYTDNFFAPESFATQDLAGVDMTTNQLDLYDVPQTPQPFAPKKPSQTTTER